MEGRLILLVLTAFVTPGMAWMNGNWSGCPSSQVCVMSPPGCNQSHTCLFATATNVSMSNATILSFTLAGNSSGNITLMLSEPSMNSSTNFTCGHNASANNSFFFSSPLTNLIMINNQGSVNGSFIKCKFNFTFANISSIFNTSDLDLLSISLSSFPPSPTTLPTPATVNGTAAATNATVNGTAAATNATVNGTAAATNATVNGTAATNATTTTTTTLMPATTKPTGASVALHPYASLLLLSLVSLFILQKV